MILEFIILEDDIKILTPFHYNYYLRLFFTY